MPQAWAKPSAAGTPESGTGTTTSASAGASRASSRAHALAHLVDVAAVHDGIGPGEVDVLEDAGPRRLLRREAERLDAVLGDHHDLAVLDVAHEARADDVEGAGLRGQDVAAVELAEHQRADAERVAGADQLLVGQRDEGVGALDLRIASMKRSTKRLLAGAGDEVEDDLGVRGRLADGAVADQVAAQRQAVGEVAVVGDGEAAALEFGEQRLHVAQHGLAGGGVADVADRREAFEALDVARSEKLSPTRPSLRSEWKTCPSKETMPAASWPRCCRACRPSAVIAAASGMAVDAEDAAFLAQRVAVADRGPPPEADLPGL